MIRNSNISKFSEAVDFSTSDKDDGGKALPMINLDMSQGIFTLNPDAEEVIKNLSNPLGIISVAGMYRTGKSYLLNRMLLNRSNGFSVGPSINPCTKGLWMWSKAIPAHTPQGKPINVLIIDTEGIGATDEDHNHDNKIMTLAILLSSYFLFNSMGTIDENSIQSLSFIVNITKNIQKRNGNTDFAKYLPAFMWVIRDFSLQLKNREGQPITSKEYLEYSLELQPGSSDVIKNKNQIRKLVKEYFPNRNCVTLVRPLIGEGDLQKLERTPVDKLRKEFIEQVNYLRKTVLNSINPKKLNGQELTGEMLLNLIKSYIKMINEGAVPVIQTAWTYMRQNQTLNARKKALDTFNKKCEEISKKLPMKEDNLKTLLKKIIQDIFFTFSNEVIGEPEEKDIQELKNEIKKIKTDLCNKNVSVTEEVTKKFLAENYKNINEKVYNGEYNNIIDYTDEIDQFVQFCLNKSPPGPGRDVIIYEFVIKSVMENSEILSKNNINEMEKLLQNNSENINALNKELTEAKNEKNKMESLLGETEKKLDLLNKEKEEVYKQNNNENENLNKLIQEKSNQIVNLKKKLNETEKANQEKIIEMKKKVNEAEKASHDKEVQSSQISSNFQKEKVLMEQKILFLEKTLKELESNKLKSSHLSAGNNNGNNNSNVDLNKSTDSKGSKKSDSTAKLKASASDNTKDKKDKLEQEIKRLNKLIKELQEKNIELDSQLLTKGKRIENEKANIQELVETYQKKLEDLQDSNSELAKDINKFKEDSAKTMEKLSNDYEEQIEEILNQQKTLDEEYKTKEDTLRKQLAKLQAELSVLQQDKEIIENKISQIKEQNQNEKIEHDKYIKILEENNKELLDKYENTSKTNNLLKASNQEELNNLINDNKQKETEVVNKNNELKNILNTLITENDTKLKQLKSQVKDTENNIIPKLKQSLLDLQNEKENLEQDIEFNGKSQKHKIAEISLTYEDQKEEILTKNRQQLEDNNNENDQQISEIRKVFQIEKDKINEKIRNENTSAQERINQIEKEQNEILNELEKEKDDKIAELQDQLEDLNIAHEEYIKKTERELLLRNQRIESLQKFINDTKGSIEVIKLQQEKYLEEQKTEFENEKEKLNEKIKKANKDCETTEIEISKLTDINKGLESNIQEIKEKKEELEMALKDAQNENEKEISELKEKLNNINIELNLTKANNEKELELKTQKIEFLNTKLNEIKTALNELKDNFEKMLGKTKDEVTNEYTSKIDQLQKEKEKLENILNDLDKEYSDLQQKYEQETELLSKEKESVTEKLNDLTIRKKKLGDELDGQHCTDQTIILKLKNEFKLKNDGLLKDNLALQEKLQKLEQTYNKLTNSYDSEKINWENKFSFINEQKENIENELNDLKQKYDVTMDELQQKILEERERLEQMYKKSLQDGENIHNEQLRQAQETFNKKYEEVNIQNNNLIAENATLTKKIEDYQNNSMISDIDKKLQEALEKEKKYIAQFEQIKKEKNDKISQLKQKLQTETENHKKKLEELESNLQDYEGKRNDKNTAFIKQKAVNDKENENKINIIQQLNETLERLKKENEKLTNENKEAQRENENIRKSSRGSSRGGGGMSGMGYIPRRRAGNASMVNREMIGNNSGLGATIASGGGMTTGSNNNSIRDETKGSTRSGPEFGETIPKAILTPLNFSKINNGE